MFEARTSERGQINRHTHPQRSLWKRLYTTILLTILPVVLKVFSLSKKVRAESAYLQDGFVLKISIMGFSSETSLLCTGKTWKKASRTARPNLTITFRDLDYAYDIFSGALTLKEGLSARLFTTHGPNDKGVAVTYLFAVILKTIFGWRKAYRR